MIDIVAYLSEYEATSPEVSLESTTMATSLEEASSEHVVINYARMVKS